MSVIRLFRIGPGQVDEFTGTTDTIDKPVRAFFDRNLEASLGVRGRIRPRRWKNAPPVRILKH